MPISKGRGKEIGHRRMAFDYRIARSNISEAISGDETPTLGQYLITLAVTATPVEEGKLGYTDGTGYGLLADVSNNKPAQFVYQQGGSQSEKVPIIGDGEIVYTNVTLNTGYPVYLSVNGLPTTALPTAGMWQAVGYAIDTNNYIIEIDEHYYL